MVLICCTASVAARDHVVVIGGIGGNDHYEQEFTTTIGQLSDVYRDEAGDSEEALNFIVLHGSDVDKESIRQQFDSLSAVIKPEDNLLLMLIGHGTYDGEHYRFNITGPDLTGQELKTLLHSIEAKTQLVVLATSASGSMLKTLEASERVLVTATKSGSEANAVQFGRYWADALLGARADFDRNEIISVEEAFRYASAKVDDHYSELNLLATEHSRMIGRQAQRLSVARTGSLLGAGNNPAVTRLLADRTQLELELDDLRLRKTQYSQTEYLDELEILMLQMARLQRKLDRETGWLDRTADESDTNPNANQNANPNAQPGSVNQGQNELQSGEDDGT